MIIDEEPTSNLSSNPPPYSKRSSRPSRADKDKARAARRSKLRKFRSDSEDEDSSSDSSDLDDDDDDDDDFADDWNAVPPVSSPIWPSVTAPTGNEYSWYPFSCFLKEVCEATVQRELANAQMHINQMNGQIQTAITNSLRATPTFTTPAPGPTFCWNSFNNRTASAGNGNGPHRRQKAPKPPKRHAHWQGAWSGSTGFPQTEFNNVGITFNGAYVGPGSSPGFWASSGPSQARSHSSNNSANNLRVINSFNSTGNTISYSFGDDRGSRSGRADNTEAPPADSHRHHRKAHSGKIRVDKDTDTVEIRDYANMENNVVL